MNATTIFAGGNDRIPDEGQWVIITPRKTRGHHSTLERPVIICFCRSGHFPSRRPYKVLQKLNNIFVIWLNIPFQLATFINVQGSIIWTKQWWRRGCHHPWPACDSAWDRQVYVLRPVQCVAQNATGVQWGVCHQLIVGCLGKVTYLVFRNCRWKNYVPQVEIKVLVSLKHVSLGGATLYFLYHQTVDSKRARTAILESRVPWILNKASHSTSEGSKSYSIGPPKLAAYSRSIWLTSFGGSLTISDDKFCNLAPPNANFYKKRRGTEEILSPEEILPFSSSPMFQSFEMKKCFQTSLECSKNIPYMFLLQSLKWTENCPQRRFGNARKFGFHDVTNMFRVVFRFCVWFHRLSKKELKVPLNNVSIAAWKDDFLVQFSCSCFQSRLKDRKKFTATFSNDSFRTWIP